MSERLDPDHPWVRFAQAPTAAARISAGVHVVELVERQIRDDVVALRLNGVSWAAIGRALGVTGQSASRRFGPLEVEEGARVAGVEGERGGRL